jgi:hypothetical protein
MAAEGTSLVDAILGWLPRDTETLVVAQQPFVIPESKPDEIQSTLVMAQSYVLGLLTAAEGEKLEKSSSRSDHANRGARGSQFRRTASRPQGLHPFGHDCLPGLRRVRVRAAGSGINLVEKLRRIRPGTTGLDLQRLAERSQG